MLMTRFSFFDCIMKPLKLSVFVLMSDEEKSEKGIVEQEIRFSHNCESQLDFKLNLVRSVVL